MPANRIGGAFSANWPTKRPRSGAEAMEEALFRGEGK